VTGDDEDNLVVSLLAKQEFGVPRVVARVNNPKNYWMFNQMWGVDVSVSTPHLITSLVQEATTVGNFVRLMQLKGGRAELVEVTLADTSPAVNKTLAASPTRSNAASTRLPSAVVWNNFSPPATRIAMPHSRLARMSRRVLTPLSVR